MIETVISPKENNIGDGFIVRRSLPSRGHRMVGPFIFWDHMGPIAITEDFKMKVRAHPHIGLSTLTFLFSGEIVHRDSLGFKQVIRPGQVNWMTAGRGISHSERSEYATLEQKHESLEGIQVWIALPKEAEEREPSFQHYGDGEIPSWKENNCQVTLIAGEAFGQKSPVAVFSPLFYLYVEGVSGQSFQMPVPEGQEAAVYISHGQAQMDDQEFSGGNMLILKPGTPVDISFSEDSRIMVFGGTPFAEQRHIYWNFVSSSKERIEQAKQDWKDQKFGEVIDEKEWIPLPDS